MDVLLSRTHYPVTVLGPGCRAGIWFQGCTIGCQGCMSLDTWRADPKTAVPVATVLAWLRDLPVDAVDGITISGGEPTEQPAALAELLAGVQDWRAARPPERPVPDVLVFTGRDPGWLATADAHVLTGADAVVAGPFVAAMAGETPLRGSDNQVLLPLTDLGRARYADMSAMGRQAMQVEVADGRIWMIGIPLPGDLDTVRTITEDDGVRWTGRSWRAGAA